MNKEDRISDFPDEIIHNIFSFLGDMTEIVATSILSKRWRYLWTSAPNLVFEFLENDYDYVYERLKYFCRTWDDEDHLKRLEEFFDLIDHILFSYTTNINKFSIECYSSMDYELTTGFVAAAVKRNVQEIHLLCNFDFGDEPYDPGGELTDLLFTSNLRVFKFANYNKNFEKYGECRMYMPQSISTAANIRILKLDSAVLPTTASGEVVLKCAVLENLSIKNCHIYDAWTLIISAPLLNKLKLKNIYFLEDYMECQKNSCINVRSSNLKYLLLSDYKFSGDFTLEDPSTLISVNLNLLFKDYKENSPQCLMKVLAEISNVKTLSVPFHLVEVMANSLSMLELLANRFLNLQHVIMNNDFTSYFPYEAVATVLQTFPRRVNPIYNTHVPVDPSSLELLEKLLEQKDLPSSKNCQD